jgi:hypothetical protein
MTTSMIASLAQLVVNSLQLLLAKCVQVVTIKLNQQQMGKNVHHALPVDLLPMIVMTNLTMMQRKIV